MIQRLVNKIVLIALLLVSFSTNSFSQEENMKWALKTSYSLLWYNGELGSQFLNFGERSDGAKVSFAKYLSPSFDVEMGLEYFRLNLSGDINTHNYTSKGNIFAPSLALNYKFNNNYILPVSAKVKPYMGVGFNYLIGQVKGIGYNLKGDNFTHFVDEIALNTSVGAKYDLTKRIGAFVELNSVLATTEELDGAAIDMKNDLFGGIRIGLVVKISREKDQDHDGVPDNEDECPDTPEGVKVDEKGCPLDTDKDGIPDFEDDCPDDPGLPKYNGCPDTDGDGIIDKIDDCPELPGLPEYNGCPDTDGDGVIDPNDLCPGTQAGVVVDEYGCPIDSDGDGLYDAVDQCPDEYGPMEYLGCPEPPDVGWPSTDNDTPPEVYFETNQFELDPVAEEEMQKMVKYLFENPNMNIRLYGSADPRGSKEYNAVLSARRVEAVKKFLLRKGVPENRIMVKALGETQEIKTSKKEEGVSEDQRLKKYRKVLFQTFFFMR
ncbi:MAG: OmpA family protein [Prolixibacteraceae bacterium]|jgi:OOP family OmpA-OmpF porin|nr:OmpA family protein [Prolixibacteraceae bacterium]